MIGFLLFGPNFTAGKQGVFNILLFLEVADEEFPPDNFWFNFYPP